MASLIGLDTLPVGSSAVIRTVGGAGALRLHLLDMGLIPRTAVKVVKIAPMGDPMEIQVRGYELTLRLEDASNITVEPLESRSLDEAEAGGRKKKR